jgi:2-polyprenyl-6-methoxyphenol hydroxylase-like FAD-dependent oxidoreductase
LNAAVPLKLAIVGAGVAGTAAAVLLSRAGHRVDVFEAVAVPQPLGAGLLLQPTGQQVLQHLGLLDQMQTLGARVTHLYGDTPEGRPVLDMHYTAYRADAHGLGVQRGALMGVLWQALREAVQTHEARWLCGVSVTGWQQHANGLRLLTSEGEQGGYDGLIIANGTFSKLRQGMAVRQSERTYPWGAVWTVLPQVPGHEVTQLRQRYRAARQMLGLMPVGHADAAAQGSAPPGINLFWSLPVAELATWHNKGLVACKQELIDLYPACAPLLDGLQDAGQMRQARYADVVMQRWHDGPVLALGDCAHGMSPQLGQGANMALIDAWVLSRCVQQQALSTASVDWQAAVTRYSQARRSHLRFYHRASRGLTPLFQSNQRAAPWLRDQFFRWGGQLPFIRQHSMAALAGVKTGWLFGQLEL